MAKNVTATISAENTFSNKIMLQGYFNISVSAAGGSSISLQRSFDAGSNWVDVKITPDDMTTAAVAEYMAYEPEAEVYYRIGVKTGNYVGAATVRLSK